MLRSRHLRFISALCVAGFGGGVSRAVIQVTPFFGQPPSYELTLVGTNLYDLRVWCDANEQGQLFTVISTTGQDSIRELVFDVTDDLSRTVSVIAGTTTQPLMNIDLMRQQKAPGLSTFTAPSYIQNMQLSGYLGEVSYITQINDGFVAGDVKGPIILEGTEGNFALLRITSTAGNLRGDVTLLPNVPESPGVPSYGRIERLDFANGEIAKSNGEKVSIVADLRVSNVTAKLISAEIMGSIAEEQYFVEEIADIRATIAGGGAGTFAGTIRAKSLRTVDANHFLRFDGAMSGFIYLDHASLGSNNEIRIGQDGLDRQIILNARNSTGFAAWTAPVIIGTGGSQITLVGDDPSYPSAGEYPNSASSLGGGTVGVVPYKLHRTDCTPIHATTADPASVGNEILMRHYGPVYWDSGDGQPFQVERRKRGSTNSWQLQDCFTCTLDSTNDTIVKVSTSTVSSLQRGYEYRVVRRTRGDGSNILRCKLPHLAASAYPEVFDYAPLTFSVCDTFPAHSPGDADDTGIVDQDDVSSVLANWGSTACMKFGDATRDGVVNSADLQEAELYYTWEYCYSEGMAVGDHGDGFTTLGLDDETAAMSAPMTLSEAVTAMGYDDIDDFGAAFDAMEPAARTAARGVLLALISGE